MMNDNAEELLVRIEWHDQDFPIATGWMWHSLPHHSCVQ